MSTTIFRLSFHRSLDGDISHRIQRLQYSRHQYWNSNSHHPWHPAPRPAALVNPLVMLKRSRAEWVDEVCVVIRNHHCNVSRSPPAHRTQSRQLKRLQRRQHRNICVCKAWHEQNSDRNIAPPRADAHTWDGGQARFWSSLMVSTSGWSREAHELKTRKKKLPISSGECQNDRWCRAARHEDISRHSFRDWQVLLECGVQGGSHLVPVSC